MRGTKDAIIRLLKEYKNIIPNIQELNSKVNDFIALKNLCMDTSKATAISDIPKSKTNKITDPVGDLVARYLDEIEGYLVKINSLIDKKKLIETMIMQLDCTEKKVVELRYINNPDYRCHIWQWIGHKIGYEERQVRRIHDRAIAKMIKWYNT